MQPDIFIIIFFFFINCMSFGVGVVGCHTLKEQGKVYLDTNSNMEMETLHELG